MMKGSKSGTTGGASGSKAVVKGNRCQFRTRVGMNFDPRTTKFNSQTDVDEYLARYGFHLSPGIKIEFCPLDT